jgi:hypothetical protein
MCQCCEGCEERDECWVEMVHDVEDISEAI